MPALRRIPLSSLEKSPLNEREEADDPEDEDFQELVSNIEEVGIVEPPTIRPTDSGGYEVITGSRRVHAAKEAEGVDDIFCIVKGEMSDADALRETISENTDTFREGIPPRDRALALYELWERVGDTERPSPTGLSKELGVNKSTLSTWLEPLSEEWEDTVINPLSDDGQVFTTETDVRHLSERKLRSIRKTTGGGEDGEWLAQVTVEEDLTIQDLAEVREYVNKGCSVEQAVDVVQGNITLADLAVEIEEEEEEPETDDSEPLERPRPAPTDDEPTEEPEESPEPTTDESPTGEEESESPETDKRAWLEDLKEERGVIDPDDQPTIKDLDEATGGEGPSARWVYHAPDGETYELEASGAFVQAFEDAYQDNAFEPQEIIKYALQLWMRPAYQSTEEYQEALEDSSADD